MKPSRFVRVELAPTKVISELKLEAVLSGSQLFGYPKCDTSRDYRGFVKTADRGMLESSSSSNRKSQIIQFHAIRTCFHNRSTIHFLLNLT